MPCPYPGLPAFETADAGRFHGWRDEVEDLLGLLRRGDRDLFVIGPSGCGKSSLVMAGMVPRLASSPDSAGGRFAVRRMRPGTDPCAALRDTMAAERGPDRVLLIIDQLEEVFTQAPEAAKADFFRLLDAQRADPQLVRLYTLRAEFYGALIESPLWTDLHGRFPHITVAPLRGDELREAIVAPARDLGVYLESTLVERLLSDASDEPGTLPLLQETLFILWHRRTRSLLRLTDYLAPDKAGRSGLAATVAGVANGAFDNLIKERKAIARRVFLRLIQFGDGRAHTRRRQPRAALASAVDPPGALDEVIKHLSDNRLLTTDGADDTSYVDLAHEILLTAWPLLRDDWIKNWRDAEERRRALEEQAARWVAHGAGETGLLDVGEIREIVGWIDSDVARDVGVSGVVARYVDASKVAIAIAAGHLDRHRFPQGLQLLAFEPNRVLSVKIPRPGSLYPGIGLAVGTILLFALTLWSHLGGRALNSYWATLTMGVLTPLAIGRLFWRWRRVESKLTIDLARRRFDLAAFDFTRPDPIPRDGDVAVEVGKTEGGWRARVVVADLEIVRTAPCPTAETAIALVFDFATTLGRALGLFNVPVRSAERSRRSWI